MSYRRIACPAGLYALTAGVPAWAYGGGYGNGPGMTWGHGWMWGYGAPSPLLGVLMMLILFAAVVMFAALAVRWLTAGRSGHASDGHAPRKPSALDILEKRFAQGEIDEEEFEARKRHLSD